MKERIEKIVKGCVEGKRSSQKDLYDFFSEEMFSVCRYYSKNLEDAEDNLHEGFIKVFENIRQLKNIEAAGGWIRKIMVNTALAKYRKQKLMYAVEDHFEYIEEIDSEDVLDKLTADELMKMIETLTPRYRLVFNLYAIEGYAHKEIADMLGISIGTSKSNLARARYILQEKVIKAFHGKEIRKVQ